MVVGPAVQAIRSPRRIEVCDTRQLLLSYMSFQKNLRWQHIGIAAPLGLTLVRVVAACRRQQIVAKQEPVLRWPHARACPLNERTLINWTRRLHLARPDPHSIVLFAIWRVKPEARGSRWVGIKDTVGILLR